MIPLSNRLQSASESITLKLNAQAEQLRQQGELIYNLTAGQLPFPPDKALLQLLSSQINNLSSMQYSPVPGFPELRKKTLEYFEETRNISLNSQNFECVISTGAKQSLFNLIATLINPGDEVVTLAPYWVSYPEMIRYWQGKMVVVPPPHNLGTPPPINAIEKTLSSRTKAIILNTPGNPSGLYYSEHWIRDFGQLMTAHPHIQILSDEIYSQLFYHGNGPRYPYQFYPELLQRTFIIDGISKSMACTGLRIGFAFGPQKIMKAMAKIQGQSTSGANSLVQKALEKYDFSQIPQYLKPVKEHLAANCILLKNKLEEYSLQHTWYQTNGAFYFFMNLADTPLMKQRGEDKGDRAGEVCAELIKKTGVVMVPSTDFGIPNGARISLVLDKQDFKTALDKAFRYISSP